MAIFSKPAGLIGLGLHIFTCEIVLYDLGPALDSEEALEIRFFVHIDELDMRKNAFISTQGHDR